MFYTAANLLRREAVRFDSGVQFLLRTIWNATDSDGGGFIDKMEYYEMHSRITCALLGKSASDINMRMTLAKIDWDADAKGFNTLNR